MRAAAYSASLAPPPAGFAAGALRPGAPPPQQQQQRRQRREVQPWMKAVAGSVGGVVEACVLQPVDVMKTRLQLDKVGRYRGMAHCGATIARTEGVGALWKGLAPFSCHLTLKYTMRMGTNAMYVNALRDEEGNISLGRRVVAGLGAGVTEAVLVVTPFEVVKIRLQQQVGLAKEQLRYKGPLHAARTIVREEGVLALWSGVAPTVCRNGINQALMFPLKWACDSMLWGKRDGDGRQLTPGQSMTSGFVAGMVGPFATVAFDVVKTRMMAQDRNNPTYRSMMHALYEIPRKEGVSALFKGLVPRLFRIPPGQAIVWAVSDQITQRLASMQADD